MGQGRSNTSRNREVIPVDNEEGVEIGIDIDTELNTSLRDRYEEDRLKFHMTAEELDDYLRQHEDVVHVVYDSDFYYFSGKENVGEIIEDGPREGRVLIYDEDLRYSVYSMVDALVKVQKAYSEQTGDDVRLVRTLHVGNHIEDWEYGTRGYTENTTVTVGYRNFDFGKIAVEADSSDITVDARSDILLKKSSVESLRNGTLFLNKGDDIAGYLIERNSYNNGWFSITGSHQRSTMTHEVGHATMRRIVSNSSNPKVVNSALKEWFRKYRYDPVSGYSQKNYKEAFAECFNLFVHGGNSNSRMYKEFVTDIAPALGISNMYGCVN